MEQKISITFEREEEYTRYIVRGAALTDSFKALQDAIDKVVKEKVDKKRYLVFDFSEATMISSTCVNVINSRAEKIEESNWEIVVISPADERGDIFKLTGFDIVYPVYTSMKAFFTQKEIRR